MEASTLGQGWLADSAPVMLASEVEDDLLAMVAAMEGMNLGGRQNSSGGLTQTCRHTHDLGPTCVLISRVNDPQLCEETGLESFMRPAIEQKTTASQR